MSPVSFSTLLGSIRMLRRAQIHMAQECESGQYLSGIDLCNEQRSLFTDVWRFYNLILHHRHLNMPLDLPDELSLLILEKGYEDRVYSYMGHRRGYVRVEGPGDWHVDNAGKGRRRKDFCSVMAQVSKYWYHLIEGTPSCWTLDITYPAFHRNRHDISMELAACKTNLSSSAGCDITISMTLPSVFGYLPSTDEASYFVSETSLASPGIAATTGRLLIHAFAMLRPYANQITEMSIMVEGYEALAAMMYLLKSFGPTPRLRELDLNDNTTMFNPWYAAPALPPSLDLSTIRTPLLDMLGVPSCPDSICLGDVSFLTGLEQYSTSFVPVGSKLPWGVTDLSISLWSTSSPNYITFEDIENFLNQGTNLRKLRISIAHRVTGRDENSQRVKGKKKVALKSLGSIHMSVNRELSSRILSLYDFPILTHLSLGEIGSPSPIEDDYDVKTEEDLVVSLPLLKTVSVSQRFGPTGTPLRRITTPGTLDFISYYFPHVLGEALGPPPPPPSGAQRPLASSTRELWIDENTERGYLQTLVSSVLAQHDLSQTGRITISGPRFGRSPSVSSAGFDQENSHSHLCVIPESEIVPPAHSNLENLLLPQLRKIQLERLHCIHYAEKVLMLLSDAPALKSLKMGAFECSFALREPSSSDTTWKRHRRNITYLEVDVGLLAPPFESSEMHLLLAFSNIRNLTIRIPCLCDNFGYGDCIYLDNEKLHASLDNLKKGDVIASLPLLVHLDVEYQVARDLGDGGFSMSSTACHPRSKETRSGILRCIRSIISARQSIGLPTMSEVYVSAIVPWGRSSRFDRPKVVARIQ